MERNKEEGNMLVVDENDRTSYFLQGDIESMHAIKISGALEDWSHPTEKTDQGEPSFENVDNLGGWSSFTFRATQ